LAATRQYCKQKPKARQRAEGRREERRLQGRREL